MFGEFVCVIFCCSWAGGGSITVVGRLGLDDWEIGFQFCAMAKIVLSHLHPHYLCNPLSLLSGMCWGSVPGLKLAACDADHITFM